MGEIRLTSTPYDDVFRTLLNDCSNLIIPVINEVFGADHSGEEKIVFLANEHFMNQQDGNEVERVTDSSFKIIGRETKKYHLECQSSTDDSMLVRIFEYDTQIALDEGEIKGGTLTVTFPHSAVLYLRCGPSTPDELKIRMVTPGGDVVYGIPLMKTQKYTVEEIFQKRLLFLIPFHIFSHEKRFGEYERDEKRLGLLKQEYGQIRDRLEGSLEQREITEYTKCTIIDMSIKVLEHIARKYDLVREGVRSVMGGKILEYEAKTIREEAREKGREEGRVLTIRILQEAKKDPFLTDEQIAEKVGCNPQEVADTLKMFSM